MFRMRWISLCTIVLTVSACGAAGGISDAPPQLPGGPGGVIPKDTTPVGAATTSQQRMGVLDAVQLLVGALPRQSFDANTKLLVDYLKVLPQFVDVGSSADGTVWATFKGGQMMFIVNGGPLEGPQAPAAVRVPSARPTIAPRRSNQSGALIPSTVDSPAATPSSAQASTGTVPKSERFHLFNALGSYYSGSDPRSDIQAMLTANGYTGTSADATLPALRAVSGDGIFYLRAHGGSGSYKSDVSTQDVYALWTASEAIDATQEVNDAALTVDLATHRVVYMLFRDDRWSIALPAIVEKNRHYGITDGFINHYMSFSDNSLIYIDACESANHPNLRAAFKNASVFAGWNERAAISLLGLSARYVFDRLLGANVFAPEAPKQRPFEFDALPNDPKFGKGKAFGYSKWTAADGSVIAAELLFTKMAGDFGILAPSIWALQVQDVTDELLIRGYFGPDPGADGRDSKVTINDGASGDVGLAISSWTPTLITTDLPRIGAGSAGNVVVTLHGHKSNTRQVLAWQGTLKYSNQEAGSLTQRFDLDVRVRSDPHEVRNRIADTPGPNLFKVFTTNEAFEARYSASGSYSSPAGMCTGIEDWGGTGSIPAIFIPALGGKVYTYSGQVDAQQSLFQMTFVASDPKGLQRSLTLKCPLGSTTSSLAVAIGTDLQVLDVSKLGGRTVDMSLDNGLNVLPGIRQRLIPSSQDPSLKATLTLQWPAMTAKPAYDRTLPR